MKQDERKEFERITGLNTDDIERVASGSIAQTKDLLTKAIREVQEVIGPHGSISRLQAGGMRINKTGMGVFTDGVQKTTIDQDGNLFVGSDLSLPSTTTMCVFVNDQIYNNEEFGRGDLLIGDNSAANILYDASATQLKFRTGTTVQVYIDTDGTLKAGGGNVTLDASGISMVNSLTSWFRFQDASGTYTITIAADPNNDLEFSNLATSPAGLISFFLKLGGVTSRVFCLASDYTTFTKVPVWINPNGEDLDTIIGSQGTAYLLTINAGLNRVEISDTSDTVVHILNPGGISYINYPGNDLDTIIRGSTDDNLTVWDAGLDAVAIGGAAASGTKLRVHGNIDAVNSNVRSNAIAVNDDAATSFTPSRTFGGVMVMSGATGNGGIVVYNTATPSTGLVTGGANLEVATGVLSGTTGTDGKLTVSCHTDGKIYIENRTGATRTVFVLLI